MIFTSSKLLVLAILLVNASSFVAGQDNQGSGNTGKKNGQQFITGICTSDADCASGCCGFNTGKCAGNIVALGRDGGCGFGDAAPNDNAARKSGFTGGITSAPKPPAGGANNAAAGAPAPAAPAADPNAPGAANVGKKNGQQFITGGCTSDADCASGCCGFNTGKCAGNIVALGRDGGCGFGDAAPNDNAARKSGFTGGITSAPKPPAGGANNAAAGAPAPAAPAADPNAPGAANVGKKNGQQFITGGCTSDADCASGCCGFKSGKCAGAVIAQTRDGGCGFGDAAPNDTAAKKLQGRRYVKKELLYEN